MLYSSDSKDFCILAAVVKSVRCGEGLAHLVEDHVLTSLTEQFQLYEVFLGPHMFGSSRKMLTILLIEAWWVAT